MLTANELYLILSTLSLGKFEEVPVVIKLKFESSLHFYPDDH